MQLEGDDITPGRAALRDFKPRKRGYPALDDLKAGKKR
jgi:hypothetical protein